MGDFEKDDVTAALTKAALLLESRHYTGRFIVFPESRIMSTAFVRAEYGGEVSAAELGAAIYYLADILEGVDNWK